MNHKFFLKTIFSIVVFFPLFISILSYSDIGEKVEEIQKVLTYIDFRTDAIYKSFKNTNKFYKDNFIFRKFFIYLNSMLKTSFFKRSPIEMVIQGKDDWLFLGKEDKKTNQINYYRGLNPFSKKELEWWKQILEARRDWLKARGIKYLFIFVPNKSTIYSEYLPDYIRKVNSTSRLDQLLNYLKNTGSDLEIVDMRDEFLKWKKKYKLYRKTDTHWSIYGSYLGYKIIMERIKQLGFNINIIDLKSLKLELHPWKRGDLAGMISLQNTKYKESKRWIIDKFDRIIDWELKHIERPELTFAFKDVNKDAIGTTLFIHDSFGYKIRFFMSSHFKKILFRNDWNLDFFPKKIETEKPVLVIEEMVERYLDRIKLKNPPLQLR
jgi:hypothetical protein